MQKCNSCHNQYNTRHYCQVEASPQASMQKLWRECACDYCTHQTFGHVLGSEFVIVNGKIATPKPRPPHTLLYVLRELDGKLRRMAWVCEVCRTFDGYECNGRLLSRRPAQRVRRARSSASMTLDAAIIADVDAWHAPILDLNEPIAFPRASDFLQPTNPPPEGRPRRLRFAPMPPPRRGRQRS